MDLFYKLKEGWLYFIHHPEQTEVIVQVYILNPTFRFIEYITFGFLNFVRKVVKKKYK